MLSKVLSRKAAKSTGAQSTGSAVLNKTVYLSDSLFRLGGDANPYSR